MNNKTKVILVVVLAVVLVGLIIRSVLLINSTSSPPAVEEKTAKAPISAAPLSTQPSSQAAQTSPQRMAGLSLALPPRNPFLPLISEKKETTSPEPTSSQTTPSQASLSPLPVVVSQVPSGQSPPSASNLVLMGTVIGPQKLAIIKVGEKSLIVKQGEKIDGLTLERVERAKVVFKGIEGETILEGGKLQ